MKKEMTMYCASIYGIHESVDASEVIVKKGKKYYTVIQGNGRTSGLRFHIDPQTDMNGHLYYQQEYPEYGTIYYALYETKDGADARFQNNQLAQRARSAINHLTNALNQKALSNAELECLLLMDPAVEQKPEVPIEYITLKGLLARDEKNTVVNAMALMITRSREDISVQSAMQLAAKIDSLCCRTDEAAYSMYDYVDAVINSSGLDIQKLMSLCDDAFESVMIDAAAAKRRTYCDLNVECDSETCMFTPHGTCLAPVITGHAPRLCEEGCLDWRERDWEDSADAQDLKWEDRA